MNAGCHVSGPIGLFLCLQLGTDGDARRRRLRQDNSDNEMDSREDNDLHGILPRAPALDLEDAEGEGCTAQDAAGQPRMQTQVPCKDKHRSQLHC